VNDPKTSPCDRRIIDGRFRKADQFFEAAETIREFAGAEAEIGDAYVTLCVHSGIAAADVICCVALGKHARGQDHLEAVGLLGTVKPDGKRLGQALSALIGMKHRAGYSAEPASADQRKRARRNAERLLGVARDRRAGL
jgi:hypothetical protein